MLQHMENAITDELDEDFVNEVEIAVKAIYSQLPLKFIGSSTMNGTTFVKFLQNVVKRMNNSETSTLLSIPSEYESVIQFFAQEAVNETVRKYKERMDIMTNEKGKLPILWEEFEGMHNECILEINKSFFEKIIGSPMRFAKQLNEELSKIKEEFMETNSKKLTIHNEKIAKESWARNVEIGLTREKISSFKVVSKYELFNFFIELNSLFNFNFPK
jgi:guanylate-binding protein 1/3/4/7